MQDASENLKARTGRFAAVIFLGSAVYLAATANGLQSLISIRALVFLFVGTFAATIVVGVPFYLLQKAIASILFKSTAGPTTTGTARLAAVMGTAVMAMQVVITYFLTKLAYHWYFA